jgi:polysaccharide pyruvyl transferase WcaK-like protein
MKVLILHAYSAENAGDGLLVDEALDLLREALGGDLDITLLASRPKSFAHLPVVAVPTVPTLRGYDPALRAVLRSIDDFDLVLAVGGGYLRAGTFVEALKEILVQGPQLRAAARTRVPTVYLPQSIGPVRGGLATPLRRLLSRMDAVMMRDDRSLAEFGSVNAIRSPDLAAQRVLGGRRPGERPLEVPVLSIRAVHGRINPDIHRLARSLGTFDGYVQSTTGGNDDRPAAATLSHRRLLERAELMTPGRSPRVVIAVRLHAALMALAAGHYVVHLAYERKGFGAFGDLGLTPWVHNVNSFAPRFVEEQARALLTDAAIRADYEDRLARSGPLLSAKRDRIVRLIADVTRAAAGSESRSGSHR